ncbi:hypothetical protein [Nocardia abscessus]|uniref:hypothetical protein n=1 Tax=Nocardia abscessus TaxID=120957 RepID=UPI0012F9F387|nr:hypothetical protein [Nocardia abscessus]MCC3333568.1 hypothetical protein [Nocardia abscessus]
MKRDAPAELLDWLDHIANGDDTVKNGEPDPWQPYDNHPFFDEARGWERMFCSGGAVYQISRRVQFKRAQASYERHELICHASAKYVPVDEFLEWISPWLDHSPGDFLGYSLYEDSRPDGWYDKGPDQERPTLIFMPEKVAP